MSDMTENKYEFKTEIKQLLNILVHSLYTNKEIFLREIISNASDALDKLRFETLKNTEIADKDLPLEIRVSLDEKKNLITITDTGIGMTKEEVIAHIGTIARSGSADFLSKISEEDKNISNIIGKFGVGFYSVFMVAKEVVLKSKSYLPGEKAVEWRSDGLGSYELNEIDGSLTRGTIIEIYLKDEEKEFAENYRVQSIIKKHSNYLSFPIYLEKEKVNTSNALWREPKSSVTKEQYEEFYKAFSYDTDAPMETLHISIDAPIQYNSLLFIPKKNEDFMFGMNRGDYGLDLYIRRVLIQHKNRELLPEYLSFVKGVVDSEDLPLNISRETLQENIVFTKIVSNITSQILSHLMKVAKDSPDEYAEFWKEHNKIFKLGYSDFVNREKFSDLLRFNSSASKNSDPDASYADYISRMKEGQKEIYYVSGASREAIDRDPHTEIFRNKGLEVLYLYEPIDEFIMESLRTVKELTLKSVEQVDLKELNKYEDVKEKKSEAEPLSKEEEKDFDGLTKKIKEILGDRVTDVVVSKRLVESPCLLANPDGEMTSQMHKIMQMMSKDTSVPKKLFEINKEHKLIRNLLKVFQANSADQFIVTAIEQLYESSLLLEGYLSDPHTLVDRVKSVLENSSDWYLQTKNKA
jgi:molecular chaperone HtpG